MTQAPNDTPAELVEPGRGPGPATLSPERLEEMLAAGTFGALATTKRDGHPHLSTVVYGWDSAARVVRVSSAAGRAKLRHLAHDARAALYVSTEDHLGFVVAEGEAEVSPVSTEPGDEVGRELLALQPPFARPEDEATFLANMVADRRVVIRLTVSHVYGGGLAVGANAG